MHRIKVAHLIPALGLGGAEKFLVELLAHSHAADIEHHVLCLYKTGPFEHAIKECGVPITVLHIRRNYNAAGLGATQRALRALRPDILHAHMPDACWYGLPAGWAAGIPLRIAHLQNCHWKWSMTARCVDRAASMFATHAFACCKAVKSFYTTRVWYPEKKITVVYNPVDTCSFENPPSCRDIRKELGLSSDDIVLTCVASLTEQKGHCFLLPALKSVCEMFPETALLLAGDGPLRSALEQQATTLGLQKNVRFLGHRTDIPDILRSSDLFVLSSLWEGQSVALVEAGAAQLPVVATRIDGTPEVVMHGETGTLVPPGDSRKLADAIMRLIADPALRKNMGCKARLMVREKFDAATVAAQVTGQYRTLLAACAGKRKASP